VLCLSVTRGKQTVAIVQKKERRRLAKENYNKVKEWLNVRAVCETCRLCLCI